MWHHGRGRSAVPSRSGWRTTDTEPLIPMSPRQCRECESPYQGVADAVALLCRISSWQSTWDCPVCSIHTRTGDSVSEGYTSSLGPAVAVGLEISPGYTDQIVAFVVGRCAQYAGAPPSVMPAAPSVAQLAPTTTTGNAIPPGDAAAGVDGADDGCGLASAAWPRMRSNNTKPTAATAITTSAMAVGTTTRRRGLVCCLACRGPVEACANMVASVPSACSSAPM